MGLAIDGNEVHGIARGGQAFISLGNTNGDGSLNIDGQDYLSKSKMQIKDTGRFDIKFTQDYSGETVLTVPIDVTSNLSIYGGCFAICIIFPTNSPYPTFLKSKSIFVPQGPATCNFPFEDTSSQNGGWSGSLSRTADGKFMFTANCDSATAVTTADGVFYVLTNN